MTRQHRRVSGGEERRGYRRTFVRLWLTLLYSVCLLVALSGLIAAGPDGTDTPTLLQRLIVAPIAGFLLWFTVRNFRQGVWTGPDGITVRNQFRTHFAPWSTVDRIDPPPLYGTARRGGLQIVLINGDRINAGLFAAGPFNSSTYADAVVKDLRADMKRYRRR